MDINIHTMFENATRLKLRFDTSRGQLSVEDLWDMPLTARTANGASLDTIAIALHKEIRDTAETVSFVTPVQSDAGKDELRLKFEIAKHVIAVRVAEREAAKTAAERRDNKQRLLEIIARKQDQELESKSVDELRELVASL